MNLALISKQTRQMEMGGACVRMSLHKKHALQTTHKHTQIQKKRERKTTTTTDYGNGTGNNFHCDSRPKAATIIHEQFWPGQFDKCRWVREGGRRVCVLAISLPLNLYWPKS